ncbi:type II toxin-antitoxin system Phd/YefM family antitoxin [Streptomyces sp. HP-A2021]|uniref:type II toxin-antitoxin system prevent-host-death family antitoxin n=1 Tax=Streptomyces sp. HP-A2021 TaxID=2927875 RepID=UPI001FAF8312|nr:type II toxin-antitoxin system prevent-host-death family antitoxin [Streptomyces sp. HP-A2021]UOB09125.1 type II toxin-antitoxin system Phd/YefM family antitoxin [Streptomyces sp. HP-A2021]
MAAEQGIRNAEDGVAEVSMTYARANLTQLLREVRYGKRPGAFTERGERSAYVVPPEFYEQAVKDRVMVMAALRLIDELPDEQKREGLARDLVRYRNDLMHGS